MTKEEKQKYDEERYNEKIKDTARLKREKRKEEGLCSTCGKDKQGETTLQCIACKARTRDYSNKRIGLHRELGTEREYRDRLCESRRKSVRKLKTQVYAAYGNECVCCGEKDKRFLTVDHVNNDGGQHRRELGKTTDSLLTWAKRNGFPETLQLMCWNCNLGKAIYGSCPHTIPLEELTDEKSATTN